jgi:hypothetical protein
VLQQNYLPDFLEAAPGWGSFQKIGCAIVFAQALKTAVSARTKRGLKQLESAMSRVARQHGLSSYNQQYQQLIESAVE